MIKNQITLHLIFVVGIGAWAQLSLWTNQIKNQNQKKNIVSYQISLNFSLFRFAREKKRRVSIKNNTICGVRGMFVSCISDDYNNIIDNNDNDN